MIIKHYPSANKEWSNSVYNFNKSNSKDTLFNDKLADTVIKGHFYLTEKMAAPRSKRMRVLILRGKTKRIFVSKPYIKQTSDSNTFTVFVYNRQKQSIKRKLFFIQKKFSFYKLWLLNHFSSNKKLVTSENNYFINKMNIYDSNFKYLKAKLWVKHRIFRSKKKRITKARYLHSAIKLKHELDFFKDRSANLDINYNYLKNVILYKFLLHLISMVYSNNKFIVSNIVNNKLLLSKSNKKGKINIQYLEMLNKNLLYYINNNILDNKILNLQEIKFIYTEFKGKFLKKILNKLDNKQISIVQQLTSLQLNNLKFSNLLANLKIYLGRIYSKTAKVNIINLKYPFLDGDIYTQLITHKARKKLSFLKVLTRSIKLAKLPNYINPLEKKALNNYSNLKSYSNMSLKKYKIKANDYINNIMLNIFPNNLINKQLKSNKTNYILRKTHAILNTIKFKWISGVRIEGAGRLTRRFTASRSVYKYKYLGNLRNKQYVGDKHSHKVMPTILLRNTDKSNLQYNFNKSKRRIGAFGIKNWISAY